MIDSKLILSDKESVKLGLVKKNFDPRLVDKLETTLIMMRFQKTQLNDMYKRRNEWSRDSSVPAEDKRTLREQLAHAEKKLSQLEAEAEDMLLSIPNIPDTDAPLGTDESGNVIISESSNHHQPSLPSPAPHWETAAALDILDMQLAGRIAGPKFALFKGKGAKLLRALVSYCIALHEDKYLEILPPHMVNSRSLLFTGHLPKFSDEQYKCSKDDLWLIPTAEVPLTAAFAETVFPHGSLPGRYMGYTVSFRREVGAGGKETKGLQRIHEFHKVELLKIVKPAAVQEELGDLLEDCLKIIRDLKLKYRVVDLCCCEMGDKYARCYDIEVFSPGVNKWLEVSSAGHFSDYQARRAGIRYADEKGRKKFAYTLNGSGVATPRVWAAIIETYLQPDGSVRVPDVLIPYMGCEVMK